MIRMKQSRLRDVVSRTRQAEKILAVLTEYFGKKTLKKLHVLDVGCGWGIIDAYVALHAGNLVGIDSDEEAIASARRNFRNKNLTFLAGDGLRLPFGDGSFDLVICHQVYEHVSDSQKLFDEIYRVLAPGGVCYCAAINKWFPWEPHIGLPFLSYFPKLLARWGIRPKSYWQLQKEASKFTIIDYTQKILNNPKKYHYNVSKAFRLFSPFWRYVSPTFIFILKK